MSRVFEFWSSVEYGTFLKGLVRSAVRQNLRRKRLRGDEGDRRNGS